MSKSISKNALAALVSKSTAFKKQAEGHAMRKVDKYKKEMINEFINHPVTQEIQAGPSAQNSSGLLGGKGNLFSFIGFEKAQDPILPVINVLDKKTKLTGKAYIAKGGAALDFEVTLPTEDEIAEASKMPFESGRSWVWGIQRGIAGFGHYLRHKMLNSSRSGTGAQVKNTLRGDSFKRSNYLSQIFRNFINKLK